MTPGQAPDAAVPSVEPFRVALRTPVATARGTVFERFGHVVVLRDGPHWGRGEVAPLPGWSSIDDAEAAAQLRSWLEASAHGDLAPVEHLAPEVRAGIGAAVMSLQASRDAVPLWRALGGTSGTVVVNHLAVGSSPGSLADDVVGLVARGATTVKVKVGLRDDVDRLRALSSVVPPGVRVRLDANGGWSLDEAVDFADGAIEVLGERLEYIEDPTSTVHDLESFRLRTGAPVAVDECVRSSADLETVLDGRLAVAVVVKPPLVGGIDATLHIARDARRQGVDVVVSSLYDGPVGLAVWCHLAAAVGGDRAHGLGTATLFDGRIAAHLVPRRDRIELAG